MLGGQNQKAGSVGVVFDLVLDIRRITCKFIAELCRDIGDPVTVVQDLDASKNDHAFDIKRPLSLVLIAAIVDAEGHLAVLF